MSWLITVFTSYYVRARCPISLFSSNDFYGGGGGRLPVRTWAGSVEVISLGISGVQIHFRVAWKFGTEKQARLVQYYFQFVFASDFFWLSNVSVLFRFASIFPLHFAYFSFVFASEFCCFVSMWTKWNHAFFRIQAKRNFRFDFNFCFRSEKGGGGGAHPTWILGV